MKKIEREIIRSYRREGAKDLAIDYGGKRPLVLGVLNGKPFAHRFPGTPGDFRSLKNNFAQFKRLVRRQ